MNNKTPKNKVEEDEKRPYTKRRSRELLYYVLTAIPMEQLGGLKPIDVLRLLTKKLNDTGRTNIEVVELASPASVEIREKHK